jgi:membrane-bound lytic murein transglycosylase D
MMQSREGDPTVVVSNQLGVHESSDVERIVKPGDYDPRSELADEESEDSSEEADTAAGPDDLWDRIRNGLSLTPPHVNNKKIKKETGWFGLRQAYLDKVAEHARPYLYHIVEELERRDMPAEIALLPIIESAYRANAYSSGGAAGIWQLISSTGARMGLKQTAWYDGRRDVLASTDAALDYLETLHDKFDGNWLHALAAYNCGERTVERAIDRNRDAGRPTDYWSLDLPGETEHFVPKLLATSAIIAAPDEYRLDLDPIPNKPQIAEVEVKGSISFEKAAKIADMRVEELKALNPGFTRAAVGTHGPHTLVVPVGKADELEKQLAQFPSESLRFSESQLDELERRDAAPISYSPKKAGKVHSVRHGENPWVIARAYKINASRLLASNHLSPRTLLRVGQKLIIP